MAKGRAVVPALQFNLARLASYALLGLISAGILSGVADFKQAGRLFRMVTAIMIFMIGLKFLFDYRGIDWLEKGGAGLWKKIMPLALKAGSRGDGLGRILLGALWGLVPCGLVYTVLLTAASTANPAGGALTMLAFGAGTLPAMLGLTAAAPALTSFLEDRTVRRIIGFALVVLALWTFLMMWDSGQAQTIQSHH